MEINLVTARRTKTNGSTSKLRGADLKAAVTAECASRLQTAGASVETTVGWPHVTGRAEHWRSRHELVRDLRGLLDLAAALLANHQDDVEFIQHEESRDLQDLLDSPRARRLMDVPGTKRMPTIRETLARALLDEGIDSPQQAAQISLLTGNWPPSIDERAEHDVEHVIQKETDAMRVSMRRAKKFKADKSEGTSV